MTERIRIRIFDNVARADAERAVRECPRGWLMELRAPTRSLLQNSRMWATLDEISAKVDWYGRKLSAESWKDIFTAALKRQEVVPGIDGGFVAIGAHTSEMTVSELSDLLELMTAFAAERGVVLSDQAKEPA